MGDAGDSARLAHLLGLAVVDRRSRVLVSYTETGPIAVEQASAGRDELRQALGFACFGSVAAVVGTIAVLGGVPEAGGVVVIAMVQLGLTAIRAVRAAHQYRLAWLAAESRYAGLNSRPSAAEARLGSAGGEP